MTYNIEKTLAQLTLAEKISLLAGANMWRTVTIERLNITAVQVSDGPNGARGMDDNIGRTVMCFPVGVAMGATWNPDLIHQVGNVLAQEANSKGAHVLLAPTVNIHRTPLAGRNFECFAEDPYLSGTIASAYINGLQEKGVAACIKHFVCNDQEYERFSISAEVTPRPLHEIYLEPFRIALENANPWTLMSAYNRINGTYASAHEELLRGLLKEQWGYDGYVISDWYGTYDHDVPAGALDLEMPGPARFMDPERIATAVEEGKLDVAVIDDKVRRLLRLLNRVKPIDPQADMPDPHNPDDRALARRVAQESMVLLKNEDNLLPLEAHKLKKIAVIGENGYQAQIMGGGSSGVNPHWRVSPLEGVETYIAAQEADTAVSYAIGTPIHRTPPTLDMNWATADNGQAGFLTVSFYPNRELAGEPCHVDVLRKTELTWFGTANPYVDPTNFSLRLSGTLTLPETKTIALHLASVGQSRLLLDGEVVLDNWQEKEPEEHQNAEVKLELEGGREYRLVLEYITDGNARWRMVRLGCPLILSDDPIQEAVDLAAESDVAIIVAGLTNEWETEGFDRPDMDLVGAQNELIERVTAVNPNTIVVLNVGSPVNMPWLDKTTAVVQAWYGGQEMGHALADVLFGVVSPSGKLPTTFPARLQDNPSFINYPGENGKVHYGEGVYIGYRYYDKVEVAPLFPFGFGLSYTHFAYSNARLNGETFTRDEAIELSVDVTNTGDRAGQEIVQVYVSDVEPRVSRPPQELKAFAKVALEPGETKTVTLTLTERDLAFYDAAISAWVTESGAFELRIGASSRDIRATLPFQWKVDATLHGEPVESVSETQMSTVPVA